MVKIFQFPKNLKNNTLSYNVLIDFYNEWKYYKNEHIIIDLSKTTYIEANLGALLGAIFDDLTDIEYLNSISIININDRVKTILQKNNFLSYFGYERIEDTYHTTVEYRKIKVSNVIEFIEYLNNKLFTIDNFPDMPASLKKTMISSLAEIFVNAGMHSGCEYVYICGQNFPKDQRLDFSIVNLGTTIKENVDEYITKMVSNGKKYYIPADIAIDLAVKPEFSTKENESGGFGLSKTADFVKKNKGELCIISDNAYWLLNSCGTISMETFTSKFNGTMVNLEINMNDKYNYDNI